MKHYHFAFICMIFLSCEDKPTASVSYDSNYPTILPQLDQGKLDSLNKILNQLCGTKYIATLENYGLLGHPDFPVARLRGSSITNPEVSISIAKRAVIDLSLFTNVFDTSSLVATSARRDPGTNEWEIDFADQSYMGIPVAYTLIRVIVADKFVLIGGHFYKYIYIPNQYKYSKEQVKEMLVGMTVRVCDTYYTFPDSAINLDAAKEIIVPSENGKSIELHVQWNFVITLAQLRSWTYRIDVMTGQSTLNQNFRVRCGPIKTP